MVTLFYLEENAVRRVQVFKSGKGLLAKQVSKALY